MDGPGIGRGMIMVDMEIGVVVRGASFVSVVVSRVVSLTEANHSFNQSIMHLCSGKSFVAVLLVCYK